MKHDHSKPRPKPHAPSALSGTVAQYLPNPRGEVDGLLLQDGTIIKFPPHLARELTQVAVVGAEVTANGHLEGQCLLKGHVVFNPGTGHAPREIKPDSPERAGSLATKSRAGKINIRRTPTNRPQD